MEEDIKKPNVLFVNILALPFKFVLESFSGKANLSETLAMPLGILYLSSYLKSNSKVGEVALLDYPGSIDRIKEYPDVESYIAGEARRQVKIKPDIICISLMFSTSWPFFKLASEILKNIWPEAKIIAGGVHATNCADVILNNTKADFVVRGEGEIALSEFVNLWGQPNFAKVKGVYSKDDLESISGLELAKQVEDLNSLPFPDWDLLDMDKYCNALGRRRPMDEALQKKMAAIMTTRGCPFRCTFCSAHSVHGRNVRLRSVENIIQEIKALNEKYGVNLFIAEDDLFTADPQRLLAALKGIKDLNIPGLEIQFPNNLHINTTTEEIIDALIECGSKIFTFAVESGSDYVQKNIIKKNCNLEKAKELVRLCHKKGVIARCCFVIGFPGETKELLEETYQYMKTLGADWNVISIATPLVGSEMYEQFLERGDIQHGEDRWTKTYFIERDFDTQEISAKDLNEFRYRVNLDVNFINNINLKNGNFDRAISLFNDILSLHPFHIFAYYGLYSAYIGKGEEEKAKEILTLIKNLINTDKRAEDMYEKYNDLLPEDLKTSKNKENHSLPCIREKILEILYKGKASHTAAALSVADILSAVYRSVDTERIKQKQDDRDRVILSKGHAVSALYAVLNRFGLLSDEDLETYHKNDSVLIGHAVHLAPCVEHSTGALGHGLPVGVGIALGLRSKKINSRVYVVLGDGELQEGSNWEAFMLAGHHKLKNLCVLIDNNNIGGTWNINQHCSLEPLKKKLESFNFETFEVDGHNEEEIYGVIQRTKSAEKPIAIICHTIKGKGVSFMENNNVWQYRPLNEEYLEKAVSELKETRENKKI